MNYNSELENNDREYQKGLVNDIEMIKENIEEPSIIYYPAYFQPEIIIKYLQKKFIKKYTNMSRML